MACTRCLENQCSRGMDYFSKVTAATKYICKNASSGITLDDVALAGGFSRTQWFGGMKDCVELVSDKRIVYAISPVSDNPKRRLLETMSIEEEERTRHIRHR